MTISSDRVCRSLSPSSHHRNHAKTGETDPSTRSNALPWWTDMAGFAINCNLNKLLPRALQLVVTWSLVTTPSLISAFNHSASDVIVGDPMGIHFFVPAKIYKSTEDMCCKRSWREFFASWKRKAHNRILYSARLQWFREDAPHTEDFLTYISVVIVNKKVKSDLETRCRTFDTI